MSDINTICILAKNPKPGSVKTNLGQCLGSKQAALLSRALLMDTMAAALRVPRAANAIAFSPDDAKDDFENLIYLFQNEEDDKKIARRAAKIGLYPLIGKDMGDCINGLSRSFLDNGSRRILYICSDNPLLDPTILRASFELLKSVDIVIGPTFDGGFYILGVNGSYEDILGGVNWSAKNLYMQLTCKFNAAAINWQELEISYDVDGLNELEQLYCDIDNLRLAGKNDICVHTERYLANLSK